MLVLCDFDGTITLRDVTNAVLDNFTGRAWRDEVLTRYRDGQINHFEVMQGSYAYLQTPLPELLTFSRTMPFRPNFDTLVSFCQSQRYHLAVVSGGLDWYIEALLPPGVPFHSYLSRYDEARQVWTVHLPDQPSVDLAAGQDFKVRVLEELRREYPAGGPVVFIGDGRNDGPVAAQADHVFAVKGSWLAQICAGRGQPCTEFEDFAEVIGALSELEAKSDVPN